MEWWSIGVMRVVLAARARRAKILSMLRTCITPPLQYSITPPLHYSTTPLLRTLGDDGRETRAKADGLESWSNSLSTQNHLVAILQKSAFFS
jgi:hypothetical protein